MADAAGSTAATPPKKADPKVRTVTLKFITEEDLKAYGKIATDAANDDRELGLYIMRYLRGYESGE